MRDFTRFGDQFPTVTFLLSKPATGEDIESWVGFLPFANLNFDHRPDQAAYVGFILDIAYGDSTQPTTGIRVTRMLNDRLADVSPDFDPRKLIRQGVFIEVLIPPETPELEDIPLVVYCVGIATDAQSVESIVMPTPTTNSSDWVVKALDGSTVPSFWVPLMGGIAFSDE
jgi:hypothetical protein